MLQSNACNLRAWLWGQGGGGAMQCIASRRLCGVVPLAARATFCYAKARPSGVERWCGRVVRRLCCVQQGVGEAMRRCGKAM